MNTNTNTNTITETNNLFKSLAHHPIHGDSKIDRYKWKINDEPGVFQMISKFELEIPKEYQRDLIEHKAQEIASNWSWLAFGVIIVALRQSGYFVVEGQHRVSAAMRRADITKLPCLVFQSDGLKHEAEAFLKANTKRSAVPITDRLKALSISGDPTATYVIDLINQLGLEINKSTKKPKSIQCVASCIRLCQENRYRFTRALKMTSIMAEKEQKPIFERVLESICYLDKYTKNGLDDKRLSDRLEKIGCTGILEAAAKASSFYARGGNKVWAIGVLEAVNKNLQIKFELQSDPRE